MTAPDASVTVPDSDVLVRPPCAYAGVLLSAAVAMQSGIASSKRANCFMERFLPFVPRTSSGSADVTGGYRGSSTPVPSRCMAATVAGGQQIGLRRPVYRMYLGTTRATCPRTTRATCPRATCCVQLVTCYVRRAPECQAYAAPIRIFRILSHGEPCVMLLVCVG